MPKIINPAILSSQDIENLRTFFEAQHRQNIDAWKKNTIYTFADQTQFQFSHNVVRRLRKNGKPGIRYEFYKDNPLGQGSFSQVYEIVGSLNLDSQPTVYKRAGHNNKTRVVKIQNLYATETRQHQIIDEYRFASLNSDLSMKPPVFEAQMSYLVMRKWNQLLMHLIQRDRASPFVLTIPQRIILTQGLLLALKHQVTDKNIIHRDIKPENIFVNNSDLSKVVIFDYGLSIAANQGVVLGCGSLPYCAPEPYNNLPHTPKSDVFSMGRVIALIWGASVVSYNLKSKEEFIKNASNIDLSTLFSGIYVNSQQQKIIRDALYGMMHKDEKQRLSIDEAIAKFNLLIQPQAQNNQEPALKPATITTTAALATHGVFKAPEAAPPKSKENDLETKLFFS